MEPLDKFKLLMADIGEVLKASSVVQFENGYWLIEYGDSELVWVYYHQQDDSFTLSGEAGAIEKQDQLELYKFFLTFNALGQEQRSVKTALSGNGDSCLLLGDYSATSLNTLEFSAIFFNFAEQMIHWRYLLKSWPTATSQDKQKLVDNISFMNPNMIRA
ncbi:type III secretion system chaperone [Thalassomonas sp. RHCl1]|uniref:type III secretion system chaperone n=1 Tax=Thalassomonas sp. RHCl1 TaxID=2995320 RepID=UPI00248C849A|nr:type III secretion system chaperone [Thalassomonas sp. RHCl1]